MRMSLLIAAAALGACTTAPQPETRSAKAEAHLQKLLAGKVAGPPMTCLPHYRSNDMVVIDDNTLIFRSGSRRVYRNDLQGGGCSRIGSGHYALLTRLYGGSSLCRGQIAEVVDVANGITVGSCVIGDFVPYTRPHG
ncbi:MAG: hypothetical protein ABIP91_00750 [Sphingomicrobium sp.]